MVHTHCVRDVGRNNTVADGFVYMEENFRVYPLNSFCLQLSHCIERNTHKWGFSYYCVNSYTVLR